MTKSFHRTVAGSFNDCWVEDKATGCWEWQRGKCKGYGVLKWNGQSRRAYVVSFEIHFGHIEKGAHVLHSCNNVGCVNPEHLRLGTHADNMRDRAAVYRPNGEAAGAAKLTTEQAVEIKRLVSLGFTQKESGLRFGVTQSNVSMICRGKSWPELAASA